MRPQPNYVLLSIDPSRSSGVGDNSSVENFRSTSEIQRSWIFPDFRLSGRKLFASPTGYALQRVATVSVSTPSPRRPASPPPINDLLSDLIGSVFFCECFLPRYDPIVAFDPLGLLRHVEGNSTKLIL